ncbi:SpoVAD [Sporosarcina koreensis]|uniref:SpoVAD n=1 Tax=Sporosarcina koreensis TaxID=334735 RepID=UPI00059118B8|nr:SpoVAD [Sporosarcina koreensis]
MVNKGGLLSFPSKPVIASTGVTVGPLETKKSPFAQFADKQYEDERCDLKTNEQGHAKMMEESIKITLSKVDKTPSDAEFLLIGDLVNEMTPSNFAAGSVGIPYIGMFSACATSVSTLLMAALLTEAGISELAVAGSASQHNAIERQFRYPLQYGSQKGPTAQWTATAAGTAAVVPYISGAPVITCGTIGTVVDLGLTDPLNMGAAMAPAAADTFKRHLEGHSRKLEDFDLVMTGDLGKIGFELFKTLLDRWEYDVSHTFRDAGAEFYGKHPEFLAGASGSGCSASVYFSEVYDKLLAGQYKRVLLIATGSLMSPLSYQQGETIPCIAHAVEIEMK